ncbi:MAG: M48 family metalloprotease [Proteobacteria bacterium]|nr:M48 family metalloprotease [Pseudomonadota bacterium]
MRLALAVVLLVGCGPPPPRATTPRPPVADPDEAATMDAINTVDLAALHRKATRILHELVDGLPPWYRDQVAHVSIDFATEGVNAYASCAGFAQPRVTVTDDLLHVLARLAAARAAEEVFDVDATAAYVDWMAAHQRADGALVDPPQDREDPRRRLDRHKLTRQHELFDEGLAWVLGHELAHHYLHHLTCEGDGGIVADVRAATQEIVPAFHQPDELAADAAGIANTLRAGQHRPGYTWQHRGALLLLSFFARQQALGVPDLVFAFARTHPPAQLRIPLLQGAVMTWYVTNGVVVPAIPYPRIPLAAMTDGDARADVHDPAPRDGDPPRRAR